MKKLFLGLLTVLTISASAQTLDKFERVAADEFPYHINLHSLETSSGDIVMMEECYDVTIENEYDYIYDTKGVNLLKINAKGEFVDSKFVDFTAIQYYNPFIRNPFEDNSNLMAGFYLNEEDEKYHYKAVFFDNDLNVTETTDVPFEAEGFCGQYVSMFDDISNSLFMAYRIQDENTYVYVRMNIYGEIISTSRSSMLEHEYWALKGFPLFIYKTEPLQYGCTFINAKSGEPMSDFVVILDENLETIARKELGLAFDEEYSYFVGGPKNMIRLNDGNIAMFSEVMGSTNGMEYLQLTKFDTDFKVQDYARIGKGYEYDDADTNEMMECLPVNNGDEIYVVWRKNDKKEHTYTYNVSKLDKDFNLKWEREIVTSEVMHVMWEMTSLENGGVAISGSRYTDFVSGVDVNATFCFILHDDGGLDDTASTSEYIAVRPYSFYPNPAGNRIFFRFSPDVECEKIEIFGLDGRLYHEQGFSAETVNAEILPAGIYMMKVTLSDGQDYTEKLIIK